jgi:hypothetical protein
MKVLGFLKEQQKLNRISKQSFCNEANIAGRQPLTNWKEFPILDKGNYMEGPYDPSYIPHSCLEPNLLELSEFDMLDLLHN